MSYLFSGCYSLTSIDLSSFNTSLIKSMNGIFFSCRGLKYLNLSNFSTKQVISISYIFCNCESLIYLNLFNFNFTTPITIDKAFDNINPNVKYCIKDLNTKNYLLGKDIISVCSDTCYNESNIK